MGTSLKRKGAKIYFMAMVGALWAQAPQPIGPPAPKPTEVLLSRLQKAEARTIDGEDLGKVRDITVDPYTGRLRFVVVTQGGLLGIAEKRVPIPWQAVVVQSEDRVELNVNRERLRSAPTVAQDYTDLNNPGYLVSLYQFYEVKPTAVGAPGETPGGNSTGTGKSGTNP